MNKANKKILIIEDEPSLLNALRERLEEEGLTVLAAKGGREGWKKVRREPDLVLLDLMLPEMSGEQILKLMNENGLIKKIPVIVLSVKGDEANTQNCLKVWGAKDYLVKSDYTLEGIVNKIKKLLKI